MPEEDHRSQPQHPGNAPREQGGLIRDPDDADQPHHHPERRQHNHPHRVPDPDNQQTAHQGHSHQPDPVPVVRGIAQERSGHETSHRLQVKLPAVNRPRGRGVNVLENRGGRPNQHHLVLEELAIRKLVLPVLLMEDLVETQGSINRGDLPAPPPLDLAATHRIPKPLGTFRGQSSQLAADHCRDRFEDVLVRMPLEIIRLPQREPVNCVANLPVCRVPEVHEPEHGLVIQGSEILLVGFRKGRLHPT